MHWCIELEVKRGMVLLFQSVLDLARHLVLLCK